MWIRAISSLGELSPWSPMQQFTVVAAEGTATLPGAVPLLDEAVQILPAARVLKNALEQLADGSEQTPPGERARTSNVSDEDISILPDPAAHSPQRTRTSGAVSQGQTAATYLAIFDSEDPSETDIELIDLLMSDEAAFLNDHIVSAHFGRGR